MDICYGNATFLVFLICFCCSLLYTVFIVLHISGTLNGISCNASNFPPGINEVFLIRIDSGSDNWEQSIYVCYKENYHNKFKGQAAVITLKFEVCL